MFEPTTRQISGATYNPITLEAVKWADMVFLGELGDNRNSGLESGKSNVVCQDAGSKSFVADDAKSKLESANTKHERFLNYEVRSERFSRFKAEAD